MVGSGGKGARPGMLRGGRDDRDGTGRERKNKEMHFFGKKVVFKLFSDMCTYKDDNT